MSRSGKLAGLYQGPPAQEQTSPAAGASDESPAGQTVQGCSAQKEGDRLEAQEMGETIPDGKTDGVHLVGIFFRIAGKNGLIGKGGSRKGLKLFGEERRFFSFLNKNLKDSLGGGEMLLIFPEGDLRPIQAVAVYDGGDFFRPRAHGG